VGECVLAVTSLITVLSTLVTSEEADGVADGASTGGSPSKAREWMDAATSAKSRVVAPRNA